MNTLRSLISSAIRAKTILTRVHTPLRVQKIKLHDEGPPQPFDNMPFNIHNRYFATIFFSFFFGIGLWAPYIIMWYMMAKRAM